MCVSVRVSVCASMQECMCMCVYLRVSVLVCVKKLRPGK